jgi:hypothetical protein
LNLLASISACQLSYSHPASRSWPNALFAAGQFLVIALVEDPQTVLKRSLSSGRPCLRIVYNCRDDTELEGSTLIGTGPDLYTKKVGGLLILIALLATVPYLTGCGGVGSGGSSQAPEEKQELRTARSMEPEDEESSGQASGRRLGHPALGDSDAPVVLTEYSDYQ